MFPQPPMANSKRQTISSADIGVGPPEITHTTGKRGGQD